MSSCLTRVQRSAAKNSSGTWHAKATGSTKSWRPRSENARDKPSQSPLVMRLPYTGEGQRGDQKMTGGNAAILNHAATGRALRVFDGTGGIVTYVDEFALTNDEPWYLTDAPETNGGPVRQVIVFRLRPLTTPPKPPSTDVDQVLGDQVTDVPVEQQWTEKVYVEPSREPHESERREQSLVLRYTDYLQGLGLTVVRKKIVPAGERKPLFCDVFEGSRNILVEAKGTAERNAILLALGQLFDYSRFVVPTPTLGVLVPARPRSDLEALLASKGVGTVWPTSTGFADSAQGTFS